MNIHNLRPRGGGLIFDVEIAPDIRLVHWVAKRDGSGRQKIYPPTLKDGAVSSITTSRVLSSIAQLVEQAQLEGDLPNDRPNA